MGNNNTVRCWGRCWPDRKQDQLNYQTHKESRLTCEGIDDEESLRVSSGDLKLQAVAFRVVIVGGLYQNDRGILLTVLHDLRVVDRSHRLRNVIIDIRNFDIDIDKGRPRHSSFILGIDRQPVVVLGLAV